MSMDILTMKVYHQQMNGYLCVKNKKPHEQFE
jgi:hypothetical protein